MIKQMQVDPQGAVISLQRSNTPGDRAIRGLVENSIDAGAKNVDLTLRYTNRRLDQAEFIMVDNGCGMDAQGIERAIALYQTDKRGNADFKGDNGVGLKIGLAAIGSRSIIFTKRAGGLWYKATIDYDKMVENGNLDYELCSQDAFTHGDLEFLRALSADLKMDLEHGTVIYVPSTNRLGNVKCDNLRRYDSRLVTGESALGVIFYREIQQGKVNIKVNGHKVKAYDVLEWNDPMTTRVMDRVIRIDGKTDIIFRAVKLDRDEKAGRLVPVTSDYMGGYLIRNDQEIARGLKFGIPKFAHRMSNFRFAIYTQKDHDSLFIVNYQKSDWDEDNVNDEVRERVAALALEAYKVVLASNEEDSEIEDVRKFNDAAREVEKMFRDELRKYFDIGGSFEGRKPSRAVVVISPKIVKPETPKNKDATPKRDPKTPNVSGVEFNLSRMGTGNMYFDYGRKSEGSGVLLISLNADHPSYKTRLMDKKKPDYIRELIEIMHKAISLDDCSDDERNALRKWLGRYSTSVGAVDAKMPAVE